MQIGACSPKSRRRHGRLRWRSMVWPLLLVASLAPASAVAGAAGTTLDSLAPDDDTALFVTGNTLFTVYHELGHALIDMFDLPIVGREEDAVDGFAAVMMIAAEPDPVRDELIIAVADAWRMQSDAGDGTIDLESLWGEHALDEQRYFTVVCLMVGSDPDGFLDFATEAGLPPERIEGCRDEFYRMKSGWDRLLARHRVREKNAKVSVEDRPINTIFDRVGPYQLELIALAQKDTAITRAISELDASLVLPEAVSVRFAQCDEANAYWLPEQHEVRICYELMEEFRAILLGASEG